MATREEAKEQRRRQIVRAARRLMQETGQTGFSMRALADRADVSIATPYNLFGSKQAVMYAVLDADLAAYQKRLERLQSNELEVFFRAVSVAATLYGKEPNFYQAVLFAVYHDGGTEFRSIFGGPRHAIWKHMVTSAMEAGVLEETVEPNTYAISLASNFSSSIMEWANGALSLKEMEARAHYGFAVALRGVCTPAYREALWDKIQNAQKRLNTLRNKRVRSQSTPRRQTANGAR